MPRTPKDRETPAQRERRLAMDRACAKRGRERHREYDNNRSKAYGANANARKYGVAGTLTLADIRDVLPPGVRCVFCETDQGVGIDHIIPMSKGGPNTRENLQPCCVSCNRHKMWADQPGRWSTKHAACLVCGRSDRRHQARGFCRACYQTARRRPLAGLPLDDVDAQRCLS